MASAAPSIDAIRQALAERGLHLRGGWRPDPQVDRLPLLPGGGSAGMVWMVGVVGAGHWADFSASSFFTDGQPDPLDRWSKAIGNELAARWGGVALYPFSGPTYWPFQQWASRAEPLQNSPLLLRIHPNYGLWHASRVAVALPDASPAILAVPVVPPPSVLGSLCLQCDGHPCLQACPVAAFGGDSYHVESCLSWLHQAGSEPCMQQGCLARRACPVGAAYRYPAALASFHMKAFAAQHNPAPAPLTSLQAAPGD